MIARWVYIAFYVSCGGAVALAAWMLWLREWWRIHR
jgi:hypothetical protein